MRFFHVCIELWDGTGELNGPRIDDRTVDLPKMGCPTMDEQMLDCPRIEGPTMDGPTIDSQ